MKPILVIFISVYISINSFAQLPTFNSAQFYTGAGIEEPNIVAVDDSGYIYTAGRFQQTLSFSSGSISLTSAGGFDIFITKSTKIGTLIWAKRLGGSHDDFLSDIHIAGSHLYFGGMFADYVDFDPGTTKYVLWGAYSATMFMANWDLNGNFIWAKHFEGSPNSLDGITADRNGNVFATGTFGNLTDFDPGSGVHQLIPINNVANGFVCKLNSNGDLLWVKQCSNSSPGTEGKDVAVDSSGNVYTTGCFYMSLDFTQPPTNSLFGNNDIDWFIAKYDSAGIFLWARSYGWIGEDKTVNIKADPAGNTYTWGNRGPGTAVLVKHDANGNYAGTAWFQDVFLNYSSEAIALDKYGCIYVTGLQTMPVLADFVSKLNTNTLATLWTVTWSNVTSSSNSLGSISSVAVDSQLNVFAAGSFSDTTDFDPGTATYLAAPQSYIDGYLTTLHQCATINHISDTACVDYFLDGITYNLSGRYYQTVAGSFCDSAIILDLMIPQINDSVFNNNGILNAIQTGTSYQWIDCSSMQTIPGATSQSFSPLATGSYAVIVKSAACQDTSDCVFAFPTNIQERDTREFWVSPNPATDILNISFKQSLEHADIEIFSLSGIKILSRKDIAGTKLTVDINNLRSGGYIVYIKCGSIVDHIKFFKY